MGRALRVASVVILAGATALPACPPEYGPDSSPWDASAETDSGPSQLPLARCPDAGPVHGISAGDHRLGDQCRPPSGSSLDPRGCCPSLDWHGEPMCGLEPWQCFVVHANHDIAPVLNEALGQRVWGCAAPPGDSCRDGYVCSYAGLLDGEHFELLCDLALCGCVDDIAGGGCGL